MSWLQIRDLQCYYYIQVTSTPVVLAVSLNVSLSWLTYALLPPISDETSSTLEELQRYLVARASKSNHWAAFVQITNYGDQHRDSQGENPTGIVVESHLIWSGISREILDDTDG